MSATFFVNCEKIKEIAQMRIDELEHDLKREPSSPQEKFEHDLKQETLRLTQMIFKSGSLQASHTSNSMRFMISDEVGKPISLAKHKKRGLYE